MIFSRSNHAALSLLRYCINTLLFPICDSALPLYLESTWFMFIGRMNYFVTTNSHCIQKSAFHPRWLQWKWVRQILAQSDESENIYVQSIFGILNKSPKICLLFSDLTFIPRVDYVVTHLDSWREAEMRAERWDLMCQCVSLTSDCRIVSRLLQCVSCLKWAVTPVLDSEGAMGDYMLEGRWRLQTKQRKC